MPPGLYPQPHGRRCDICYRSDTAPSAFCASWTAIDHAVRIGQAGLSGACPVRGVDFGVRECARERFAICESLLAITGGLLAIRRWEAAAPIAHQRRQIAGCGGRVSFMSARCRCFGLIDAVFKWLLDFHKGLLAMVKMAGQGQPRWLHWCVQSCHDQHRSPTPLLSE
jgi:hypothetical protein